MSPTLDQVPMRRAARGAVDQAYLMCLSCLLISVV